MTTLAVPIALFEVRCEVAGGRPFASTERTVLRAIAAGRVEFDELIEELSLHPRILSECVTVLFEAGIIEFTGDTGAFSVTALGEEALSNADFVPSTLIHERATRRIVVELLTGLPELSTTVTYERTNELRGRGVQILRPRDIDPTPARSLVRQLIERKLPAGKWIRSVGPIVEISRYSLSVRVDVEGDRLEGLRSAEWRRALTFELQDAGMMLHEPIPVELPPESWIAVPQSQVRSVRNASEHAEVLEEFLARAQTYVFIHSAFLGASRMRQLVEPISAALNRGVDVLLARGGPIDAGASDDEAVRIISKLQYDQRRAAGRFYFEARPTDSHAKILARDGEEVCVGSFNWLSAQPESARAELSLCISSIDLADVVCDAAADLFRDRGVLWPAQMLRSQGRPYMRVPEEGDVHVRLLLDAENRECLFNYLETAEERLVVCSDKVTARADRPLHEKLALAARRLSASAKLTLRFSGIDGDHASVLDGLPEAGAHVIQDGSNHVKAALCDDRSALITSFNLLSFGGRSRGRSSIFEAGIEVKAPRPSPEFFHNMFEPSGE